MNPEEKRLLERSLALSEENHKILKKLESATRWAFVWGVIKVLIILVPLIFGFIYLQPFFESFSQSFKEIMQAFNSISLLSR